MAIAKRSLSWLLIPGLPALWLLWLAPERLLGIDSGLAGTLLMALTAASAAWLLPRLSSVPGDGLGADEQRAWIGAIFTTVIYLYLFSKTGALAGLEQLAYQRGTYRIGAHVAVMLIAWLVLIRWLRQRRSGEVLEDERDRLIRDRAEAAGNGALTFGLIGLILLLAITPGEQLSWLTPSRLAVVLLHMLILKALVEYYARVIQHGWDRR